MVSVSDTKQTVGKQPIPIGIGETLEVSTIPHPVGLLTENSVRRVLYRRFPAVQPPSQISWAFLSLSCIITMLISAPTEKCTYGL